MITVYVDSNAFISAFESATERADHILRVFDAIADGEFSAATSEMTLAEILPKPFSLGQASLSELYQEVLSGKGFVQVVPVTRSILIETARVRATHRFVGLPDAIHLATASLTGCTVMLSDDRRLPTIEGIRVVHLSSQSLDHLRQSRR